MHVDLAYLSLPSTSTRKSCPHYIHGVVSPVSAHHVLYKNYVFGDAYVPKVKAYWGILPINRINAVCLHRGKHSNFGVRAEYEKLVQSVYLSERILNCSQQNRVDLSESHPNSPFPYEGLDIRYCQGQ